MQRFDALLTRALLDLGIETHALMPSSINIRSVEAYHGVSLREARIIKYGILNCGGPYCDLLNNVHGNTILANIIDNYDLIFIDTPFTLPAGNALLRRLNYVYYLHGAVITRKPKPVLTGNPIDLYFMGF